MQTFRMNLSFFIDATSIQKLSTTEKQYLRHRSTEYSGELRMRYLVRSSQAL